MNYIGLGERIRLRRIQLKMTQAELAEKANVSTQFIGQIENARRKLSLETLISLATTLDTSFDYLIRDSMDRNIPSSIAELMCILENRTADDIKLICNVTRTLLEHIDSHN